MRIRRFALFVICFAGCGLLTWISPTVFANQDFENPPPPEIAISQDVYYPMDEILYLEGRASPNAPIEVQFQKSGAKAIRLYAHSDQNGAWTLAEKVPLEAGQWEVRARIADMAGKSSSWSNPRLIKAIATGLTFGTVTFRYTFIVFIAVIVMGAGIAVVVYFFGKTRRLQRKIRSLKIKALEEELKGKDEEIRHLAADKDKVAAEKVIEENFTDLKRAVGQELEHLEGHGWRRALTKTETEHKERLLEKLRSAEERITSTIDEINKNA